MKPEITIIGIALVGCEAAWQAAQRGVLRSAPVCKEGQLIAKKTRFGKLFYFCEQ